MPTRPIVKTSRGAEVWLLVIKNHFVGAYPHRTLSLQILLLGGDGNCGSRLSRFRGGIGQEKCHPAILKRGGVGCFAPDALDKFIQFVAVGIHIALEEEVLVRRLRLDQVRGVMLNVGFGDVLCPQHPLATKSLHALVETVGGVAGVTDQDQLIVAAPQSHRGRVVVAKALDIGGELVETLGCDGNNLGHKIAGHIKIVDGHISKDSA